MSFCTSFVLVREERGDSIIEGWEPPQHNLELPAVDQGIEGSMREELANGGR